LSSSPLSFYIPAITLNIYPFFGAVNLLGAGDLDPILPSSIPSNSVNLPFV